MSRPSSAAQAAPVIDIGRVRIEPPPTASARVAKVFREVVGSVDAQHLRPCDAVTVEAFAQAVDLARTAAAALADEGCVVDGRTSPWIAILERAHRSVATLGRALRLTPNTRVDRRVAGTSTRALARQSIYDRMELGTDD